MFKLGAPSKNLLREGLNLKFILSMKFEAYKGPSATSSSTEGRHWFKLTKEQSLL